MKSVLVICFNDLRIDARVSRQIDFLKSDYKVTAVCFDAYSTSSFEVYKIRKTKLTFLRKILSALFLITGFYYAAYWLLHAYRHHVNELKQRKFDIIVANDAESLPLASAIASANTKIFFDAHEYAPRQFEDRLSWRIFFQRFNTYLCKKYIPCVSGMSTINNGLAAAYEKNFGIKPIVITNAAPFVAHTPTVRDQLPIRLVHHGIFNRSRQPEIMIELMKLLDNRFTLDLIYILPQPVSQQTIDYFESFKKKAAETGKITIRPSLKSSEIIATIHARYDMGIILVPPINFNYENGLPNKLFDCIQARLAMCVGPLREIANVVRQFKIGVVSDDFTAQGMAAAIQKISLDQLNEFKLNTRVAAQQMNAEQNKIVFLAALNNLH